MRETGGSTSQVPSGKRLEKKAEMSLMCRQHTLRFEAFIWKQDGMLMKLVPRMWVVQSLRSFSLSLEHCKEPTLRPAFWLHLHITTTRSILSPRKIAPLPPSPSFLFCYLLAPTSDIPIIYSNPMSCLRNAGVALQYN